VVKAAAAILPVDPSVTSVVTLEGLLTCGAPEIDCSDEYCARAEKRYALLQDIFGTLASAVNVARAREVLETLCVDNLPINAAYFPRVAVMLDRVAAAFDLLRIGMKIGQSASRSRHRSRMSSCRSPS
jgi:hypothetical protein